MMASSPQSPSVLIVDDSPGVLLAMQKLLSPYMNVQVAESAAAALTLAPSSALVLTDVRMPGMDGLELTRTLRQQHPNLPVVFMTGVIEDGLRSQARALGVLDVLRKPLKPGVLLPALQEWLSAALPEFDDVHLQAIQKLSPVQMAAEVPVSTPTPSVSEPPSMPPLTTYLTDLSYLPGVQVVAAFGPQGELLKSHPALPDQVGAYVRFLCGTSSTLGQHLKSRAHLQALQIEYGDRVLVISPTPNGYLVVVARDTAGASGVKAWLRTHLPAHD